MHKDIARISKEMFSRALSGWEIRKDRHPGNHDCPYTTEQEPTLSEERLRELCQEHCSSFEHVQLGRTEILQWMSFHFLNISSRGIAKNVDIQDIAAYIGCDVRTAMKNMRSLQKKELIAYSRLDTYIFNIALLGYDKYVDRESGDFTGGYLKLSAAHFDACCELACINSLKLSLQLFLTYDNHEIRRIHAADGVDEQTGRPITRTRLENVTTVLPGYMKSLDKIEQLIDEQSGILSARIEQESFLDGNTTRTVYYIRIELADSYNGKKAEETIKLNLFEELSDKAEELELPIFKVSDLRDLVAIASDIGKDAVFAAMDDWAKEIELHKKTGYREPVSNIGGYIRRKAIRLSGGSSRAL